MPKEARVDDVAAKWGKSTIDRELKMHAPNTLIIFQNGMVMAFDASGNQISEFQGSHRDVAGKLKQLDLSQTRFEQGEWPRSLQPISQTEFFSWSATNKP